MGVHPVGLPVSGPAGVSNADMGVKGEVASQILIFCKTKVENYVKRALWMHLKK